MTPENVTAIRDTWSAIEPVADEVAAQFYDRLFDIDPSTRPLFRHTDLPEQRRKLLAVIGTVIDHLEEIHTLIPTVEALGRRHTGYGVEDRHYDTVGEALLWAFESNLGEKWTPEAADAWTQAYTMLAGVMRSGGAAQTSKDQAA